MGFFSAGSKVSVSGQAYNMAGDPKNRANFLKSAVLGGILSSSSDSLADQINASYMGGPGIQIRKFASWCNYTGYAALVGLQPASLVLTNSIDSNVVAGQIPCPSGYSVQVTKVVTGTADFTYWADQYMAANYPDQVAAGYTSGYQDGVITITFASGTVVSFTPANYSPTGFYIYAEYSLLQSNTPGPVTLGSVVQGPFPDISGWTLSSSSSSTGSMDLTTTVVTDTTYANGDPSTSSTSTSTTSQNYTNTTNIYTKSTYNGADSNGVITTTIQTMTQWSTATKTTSTSSTSSTSSDGSSTTTTTTTQDQIVMSPSYEIDTQTITDLKIGPSQVFIYEQGSGNATLDALFGTSASSGSFLPYIPLRINNSFISSTNKPDIYTASKHAYIHAMGSQGITGNNNYDKIISTLAANANIGKIQFAYMTFGVTLNTADNYSRRYIFAFFQKIMQGLALSDTNYINWLAAYNAANASQTAYNNWLNAQKDSSNPLYGTTAPTLIPLPAAPNYSLQIASSGSSGMGYNVTISFNGIAQTSGTGILLAGKNSGDIWFEVVSDPNSSNHIRLNFQVDANTWQQLDIYELKYIDMIYGGVAAGWTGTNALTDTTSSTTTSSFGESGFLVPIHTDILQSLPLTAVTQMATQCFYILLNAYQVTKEPWYTAGWVQVVFFVAVVVISTVTFGGGVGLLGADVAIGTAVGFTGVGAAIIGGVANAVAALVLVELIEQGAQAVFGPKIGAIVGAIAAILTLQVGTALMNGITTASAFASLMQAPNLLRLTEAAGNGIAQIIQGEAHKVLTSMDDMLKSYQTQENQIEAKSQDVLGVDNGIFNPLAVLGDSLPISGIVPQISVPSESPDSYLSRTLMTGSDIAAISNGMITNFTDIMLNRDLILA